MTDREVMQMALDALEKHVHEYEAIQTLRTALAQPEPEPVAWWHDMGDVVDLNISGHGTPLYTAPPKKDEPVIDKSMAKRIATQLGWEPKKEWVGLTDEEISDTQQQFYKLITFHDKDFARAIEAKLKDKNT